LARCLLILSLKVYFICESVQIWTDRTAISTTKANLLLGVSGLVAGGFTGVLISQHPALFSVAAGVQCFSLGSSFWCLYDFHRSSLHADYIADLRSVLIEAGTRGQPTSSQELRYSTLAGSLSGALNGAFREFGSRARDDISKT
jgi:hypothetical protein